MLNKRGPFWKFDSAPANYRTILDNVMMPSITLLCDNYLLLNLKPDLIVESTTKKQYTSLGGIFVLRKKWSTPIQKTTMVVSSGTNAFAKEIAIRKRIASIYNKREEDFASLREFNDYLEEVEDMIFNLIEGIDVPAIEAKIAQYQRENAEQIMNAHARKAEEYAAALAASRGQPVQVNVDLSSSSQAETSTVAQGQYAPAVPGPVQPRPTGQPIPVGQGHDMMGLDYNDEEKMKLRAEKAARAGGWSAEMSKKRALEEAFASIWL